MIKEKQHSYGCIKSVLDGSEYTPNVDYKLEIPDEFSLIDFMPPVRDQGATQTCVCQTLTGMLDYTYNAINNTPGICNNFSISTLYRSRSNYPQEGMSIKEAMRYLKHTGLNGQKIQSYALITSTEMLKRCLIMFGPVAAGFPVYASSEPYFWRKGMNYQGGHCVTIVGYTPDSFIIRNSWGKRWMNKGHINIPYSEYENSIFEAWTMTF